MKPALSLVLALCLATPLAAQTPAHFTDPANLAGERVAPLTGRELPIDKGVLGLEELLRELNTRASILNIVAHPDDEDGGMLTLYARGLGARVADLSLTRGEGGQNAMTGDFEDALGLLRTQELLANDRYTGVHQFFGTEVDFGFSKTKAESFAKWGHQRVLYDVVRAIRIYRPLVITSTWIGDVTDGHGQHQVSGEIAQEAFKDAGDPKIFPELTAEGILPWQPLRMYARVPRQAVTAKGLYDYATGEYTPASFTNYVTGKVTTTIPSTDIVVHEGTVDPLLTIAAANKADLPPSLAAEPPTTELSYLQFARIGLGLQKSQIGPGVRLARSGRFDVPYHLYGNFTERQRRGSYQPGAQPQETAPLDSERAESPIHNAALAEQPNFFDGIDTSIEGIASLAPNAPPFLRFQLSRMAQQITSASHAFNPHDPSVVAPQLAHALQTCDALIGLTSLVSFDNIQKANVLHELRIKRVQLNDALVLALSLHMDATATSSDVVAKTTVPVHILVRTNTAQHIAYSSEELETSAGKLKQGTRNDSNSAITESKPWIDNLVATSSLTQNETRPYFFRDNIEQPTYQLHNPTLRNAPATPPALTAWVNLTFNDIDLKINDIDLKIGSIVHSGDQPVAIVPPASLSLSSHAQVLPDSDTQVGVTLYESDHGSPIVSEYDGAPANWESLPISTAANCVGCDPVAWRVPLGNRQLVTLHPSLTLKNGDVITEGYRPIGYGDLPRTNYFTPATDRIVPVDLKLPPPNERRIAYLPGTGDAVPAALTSIGLSPETLTVADLTPARLSHFNTVILGVRTYAAHPDLHGAPTQALLDFARAGGNVLVQYQTPEFTADDAPYPLSLGSNEKVVDETAAVHLLTTNSPLLNHPNTIQSGDFNGWIEERGHGFLGSWDPRYTALTETHDPGQAPQKGGLITTELGKGRWTYCAFALYRQLPEAVPGAYRLFINLLTPTR